jgi:SH3 domain protein
MERIDQMFRHAQREGLLTTSARLAGLCLAVLLFALPASSERAWIKDELRINLRTGPGVQFRIVGRLKTGDAVEVLETGEGWTKIRLAELGDGWIPEGYLQPTPPARLRLDESEGQAQDLRERVDELTAKTTELEGENATLAGRDTEQQSQISRLTKENMKLRAGARWPHYITGAGILTAGILLGLILRASSGRRNRARIRL